MDNSNVRYLDEVQPIPLSRTGDSTSTLQSRAYVNLSMNAVNAADRMANLLTLQSQEVGESTYGLLILTESLLVTLLSVPLISTISRDRLTTHYSRCKLTSSTSSWALPSDAYLEDLMFTSQRSWATSYGTLSYYVNLQETHESYLTPSQLAYLSVTALLNYVGSLSCPGELLSQYQTMSNLLLSDDESADVALYSLFGELPLAVPSIRQSYALLGYLQDVVPSLLTQYLASYRSGGQLKLSTDDPIINAVAQLCLRNGLSEESLGSLRYDFMYSKYSPVFYGVTQDLIYLRKTLDLSGEQGSALSGAIPITADPTLFRQASNVMLSYVCPPIGYNLLLVALAVSLVNRAHMILYEALLANASSGIPPRVMRLLYLSARLLRRSELDHVAATGNNLMTLLSLDDKRTSFTDDVLNDNY